MVSSPAASGPVEGVGAQGLQQPVAGLATEALVGDDEALVDESADEVEHLGGVDVAARGHDRLGGFEGERSGEHAESPERGLLGFVEAVVAPVDRGGQGLLAGHHGAGAAGQQPEAVVELGGDALGGQLPAAGGGQLDGERDAVEAVADLRRWRRRWRR